MMILIVNKEHIFNEKMIENIEMMNYENYCEDTLFIERETYEHFLMLQAHLKVDGIIIDIDSAYRSLETQENIFLEYMKKYGLDKAEEICDMPGMSEHHTGQAIDIVLNIDGIWINDKEELFKQEDIFKKIHRDLKYFGFILRFPKGKENFTGNFYKPWHLRYIGKESEKIGDLTLEEYVLK